MIDRSCARKTRPAPVLVQFINERGELIQADPVAHGTGERQRLTGYPTKAKHAAYMREWRKTHPLTPLNVVWLCRRHHLYLHKEGLA